LLEITYPLTAPELRGEACASKANLLSPHAMHNLVLGGLGDAAAYQKTEQIDNSAYYRIQAEFRKPLSDLSLGKHDNRPSVIVAHSLGCHITSTYAWDLHKYRDMAHDLGSDPTQRVHEDDSTNRFIQKLHQASPLERLETFAGFVTMGCNMPLFTFHFGQQRVTPIAHSNDDKLHPPFPGERLEPELKRVARWDNYFSCNDPFGYPLTPLNDRYGAGWYIHDHKVVTEGARRWITPWFLRPLLSGRAHYNYWWNDKIATGTAEMLKRIMHAPLDEEYSLFPGVVTKPQ